MIYTHRVSNATDPERMATWRAFQWANTVVMRNLERELEEEGLPLPWFDVLIHLCEAAEGRLRMQTLADSVVLSRSGVTRLVDRMERAGLVRREPSQEDRRGAYAVVTQEGRQAFERVWPGHRQRVTERFIRHLSDTEARVLYQALAKVIRANEGPDSAYAQPAEPPLAFLALV